MTIDERLEALVQSVELLAAMQRDREKQQDNLAKQQDNLAKQQDNLAKQQDNRMRQLENLMEQIMEATARLVHTAELHSERMNGHETRLERLEGK